MIEGAPHWTDIATATAAIIAIFLSVFSLYYARASVALAKAQDLRRAPKLSAEFIRGDYITNPIDGSRRYQLEVSIGNLSDSDNAITRAELCLTYLMGGSAEMTLRVGQADGDDRLRLPTRIAAHETVAGRLEFRVTGDVIKGNRIEAYRVELTDTHGEIVAFEPLLLSERARVW